ncbi:LTA synthase family protein [Algoriphagus antarcticus]|uniref:Phosphoglycerol transferase MdoB-like AlkP superfamily enzyme n=1 Tax=Algoriphagus antarcticus TaxID=238540 RepID=A0A3E0DNM2_9BACT|nr:LTA synthase family protein [Algoriphagus antarcticus]REG84430.1 phosphoglycerol transferase MdoB-like AlkP superfamily enzyme [Algoriphagus antarcticus]
MKNYYNIITRKSNLVYLEVIMNRLLVLILLYTLIRFFFIAFNWEAFRTYYFYISINNILRISFLGLYFDLITIIFLNIPVILLYLIPFKIRSASIYLAFIDFLFVVINAVALFISIADVFYFSHAMVRSSAAMLGVLDGVFLMLYQYSIEYWYGLLIFIFCFYLLIVICKRIRVRNVKSENLTFQFAIFIIFISVFSSFAFSVSRSLPANVSASVTNTPFVIVNSFFNDALIFNNRKLPDLNYFSEEELNKRLDLKKNYYDSNRVSIKSNVFVIVLESFSKDYVGFLNPDSKRSYTPFLDSLSQNSLYFTNAYANGKFSNEGMAAIYSSIPSLMGSSFMTSGFYDNKILGLGSLLKDEGYNNYFFHGGLNGMYGINSFIKKAGFDNYYGMDEYGSKADYDGAWGVWDEKFFTYTAHEIENLKEPFLGSLYSISSHHPFRLPHDYVDSDFYEHPILKSVKYTDYSLRKFFSLIRDEDWFSNTLFVIVSDHTANVDFNFHYPRTSLDNYHIPLLFYKRGSSLNGEQEDFIQQIDIIPSIIDLLNLDISYFGFGESFLDKNRSGYVFQYREGIYQIADENYLVRYDGNQVIEYYNLKSVNDSTIYLNGDEQVVKLDVYVDQIKSIMQIFNYSMNNNSLVN